VNSSTAHGAGDEALAFHWPRIQPTPLRGSLKACHEDFIVEEILPQSFTQFSGTGEHLWVWLKKTGANTEWAARQLASACEIPVRHVGYAGLKDRHGITSQWFSLQLPQRRDKDSINAALPPELRVLDAHWHSRKLRTGALSGNAFTITLRHIEGDKKAAETVLESIRLHGFPNYFGAQRFGRNGHNILQARKSLSSGRLPRQRHRRGLLLSAARSFLFNQILAHRIHQGCWDRVIAGDVLQLSGSRSRFVAGETREELAQLQHRLETRDLHPTAPLWGQGAPASLHEAHQLELAAVSAQEALCRGLESAGLKQDRRAIRCVPENLQWQWLGAESEPAAQPVLQLRFRLPAGSYATELLAELGQFEQPGGHEKA